MQKRVPWHATCRPRSQGRQPQTLLKQGNRLMPAVQVNQRRPLSRALLQDQHKAGATLGSVAGHESHLMRAKLYLQPAGDRFKLKTNESRANANQHVRHTKVDPILNALDIAAQRQQALADPL
jgi:hypothetical protein